MAYYTKWIIGTTASALITTMALGTGAATITPLHAFLTTLISAGMVATAYGSFRLLQNGWNMLKSSPIKKESKKSNKKKDQKINKSENYLKKMIFIPYYENSRKSVRKSDHPVDYNKEHRKHKWCSRR